MQDVIFFAVLASLNVNPTSRYVLEVGVQGYEFPDR